MGPWHIFNLWSMTNITGNIASGVVFTALGVASVGVGASTGVYGIIAATLGYAVLNKHQMRSEMNWIILIPLLLYSLF